MKIGVLSLYYQNNNIGGLLQSYATVYMLERLGYDAEQITYDYRKSNEKIDRFLLTRRKEILKKSSLKMLKIKISGLIGSKIKKVSKKIIDIQNGVFVEFEKSIPHSPMIYDESSISEVDNNYDIFLVGSDQVWNASMLMRDAFYLSFTHKKKIAYAVSMGKIDIIDIEKEIFKERLKSFNQVGVRENSMISVIENISDVKCTCVMDPTLMVEYDDWKKIENNDILPKKQYVFCYFLGDCVWQRKMVQKYAEEKNYLIIDLPYIMNRRRKSDKYLKGEHLFNVGPREFISLVRNAECVFTDSFHAVAFSVNFHTDFFVFDRDGLCGAESINSRIVDFLDMLLLSNRRITSFDEFIENEIDWNQVASILETKKDESREWLKHQIVL